MTESFSNNNPVRVRSTSIQTEVYVDICRGYKEQAETAASTAVSKANACSSYKEQIEGYLALAQAAAESARIYAQQAQSAALTYDEYARFCVNSGSVDEYGNPNFVTQDSTTLTLVAPFVYTTASGDTYEVTTDVTEDLTNYETADYNIFVNNNDDTFEIVLLNNKIFMQKTEPLTAEVNDIWVNTSVYPRLAYILGVGGVWAETDYVPVGSTSIVEEPLEDEPEPEEDIPSL